MPIDAHDVPDAPEPPDGTDAPDAPRIVRLQDQELVFMDEAIARLHAEFPHLPMRRLRELLTREWEAVTGGWPVLVPADVEFAVRRVLRLRA